MLLVLRRAVGMVDIVIEDVEVASNMVDVCESIASDPLGVLARALGVPHERGRVLTVEHRQLFGPELRPVQLGPGTLSMPTSERAVWQFGRSSPAERSPSRRVATVEFTTRSGPTPQLSMCLTTVAATTVGRRRRRRCESRAMAFAEALALQL